MPRYEQPTSSVGQAYGGSVHVPRAHFTPPITATDAAARLELIDPYARFAESTWRRLEAEHKPAYFLTWSWVENWLACLPPDQTPRLALVIEHGQPTAACFLGRKRLFRYGVLPSRGLFLNTTGDDRWDELCIEHNDVLGDGLVLDTLIDLLPPTWDELFLPAMRAAALGCLTESVRDTYQVRIERKVATHYVDLQKVRDTGDYIALLGSSTRAQLRKARRRAGTLELEVAHDLPHAFAIYDEMAALHGSYWRGKGQSGVFADPWFDRFHRRLIEQRLEHGEIQLVRLREDGVTVGCLYNLVANGNVLFYQSGLKHQPDRDRKPGYLCHLAAVEYSAAHGHTSYDFLAGDARYKQNLGTDHSELIWARVQRKLARFALEDRVRRWRRSA